MPAYITKLNRSQFLELDGREVSRNGFAAEWVLEPGTDGALRAEIGVLTLSVVGSTDLPNLAPAEQERWLKERIIRILQSEGEPA